MKTTKINFLIVLLLILPLGLLQGQEESSTQAFWVHEDQVKPSMVQDYEKMAKDLVTNCKEHNIQGLNWITTVTSDFRYLYVTPIKSMTDINYDGYGPLKEKMGDESFNKLFDAMDECYDTHGDYVLLMDKDLSYMPDGLTQTPEGQDYRKFYYVRTTAANNAKLKEKLMAIKEFYQEKGSKVHYRVYRSGFGTMGNYYMVAVAAKDAVSFETMGGENAALLGDERQKVFADMMQYVTSLEEVTGTMRHDLAYTPE